MSFNSWKKRVNNILISILGMPADCLPDANWRTYYDEEMDPVEAILLACECDWEYEYDLSRFIKETYYG